MFINVKARLTFKVGVYAAFCASRVFRCEDVQKCDILIPTSDIMTSQNNMDAVRISHHLPERVSGRSFARWLGKVPHAFAVERRPLGPA